MIVVTGATGTVGSRLVRLLVERELAVRVVCRDAPKAHALFGARVEIAVADLGDLDSLTAALAGADRAFLLATATAEPDGQLTLERNVITAASKAGVGHVVKLSALGADDDSPLRFGRTHRAAERELETSGLAFTILRPSGFMQVLPHFVQHGALYTCAENGRVAHVDAGDIAAVAAAALTGDGHVGRVYTLTGPAALSYDEVAQTLGAATGTEIRHVRVPVDAIVAALVSTGRPRWLAEDLAALLRIFAAGAPEFAARGDVAAVLGHPPRSFAEVARTEFAGAPA